MGRTSIHPDLANMYVNSGRIKTPASKKETQLRLRRFQNAYPKLTVERTTSVHLAEWCLHGNPSDNTIKGRRSTIKAAFDWAAFVGIIHASPAATLKFSVPVGSRPRRLGNWLTETEIGTVLRSCDLSDFHGRRERVILAIGFYMGLRASSIASMRWDQFSPDLSRWEGVIKGNKPTRKGVPPQLREILAEWRSEAPLGAVAVIPVTRRSSFHNPSPIPYWDRSLSGARMYELVKGCGERVGIKNFAPHDMRRSLAGVLQRKGVALDQIQSVLDHSNIGTTNTYLDKNPNLKIEATEAVHFDF